MSEINERHTKYRQEAQHTILEKDTELKKLKEEIATREEEFEL